MNRVTPLASALALIGFSSTARGQSLYAVDMTLGPTPTVVEFTGPPAGPCLYPNGPVVGGFVTCGACAGPCPSLTSLPPPLGDIAVDPTTDSVYVTHGTVIHAYTAAGVYLNFFFSPAPPGMGPIATTGMGFDGAAGLLWVTDGMIYGAIAPPAFTPCPGAVPPPWAAGPFPVPILAGFFAGPITDIDWEGASGSLIACDGTGIVGSFLPGPAPVPGPYGFFPAAPGPCGLGLALVGIAFDRALPGTGTTYVTDGTTVARILPGGGIAATTFYSPLACFAVPTPLTAGLAQAGRQITFGAGASTVGGPVPSIGSVGQSWVGNPAYTMTLSGSVPGKTAVLKYSFGSLCPPAIALGVLPIYVAAPRYTAVSGPVGGLGTASFTTAIPPAAPVGLGVYLEWVTLGGGSVEVTSGAELTTIAP